MASHVGRLRIRAAEILRANFPEWDVRPEDIVPASGAWRTCLGLGVYRWELSTRNKSGNRIMAGCWETLSEFVREASRLGCHESNGTIYPGKAISGRESR